MKKVILIMMAAIIGIGIANAQSLQEALKDSPELTKLFVYPCGISKPVGEMTTAEMTAQLDSMKLSYKTTNLGVMGQIFQVDTPDLKIGDVPVPMVGLNIGDALCMVTYVSSPCDNYADLEKVLTPELSKFPKIDAADMPMPMPDSDGMNMYSVGSQYGIAVGAMPDHKIAAAMMTYVKNATDLTNIFGTPQQ